MTQYYCTMNESDVSDQLVCQIPNVSSTDLQVTETLKHSAQFNLKY